MRTHKIRVRRYNDTNFPHLKFVVNYREDGKRRRRFFENKDRAQTFADERNIEQRNREVTRAEFPIALQIMAQECAGKLERFGKTIADATAHFVAHLEASEKSCTAVQLVSELVTAKERDGASKRHVSDLRSRLNIFAQKFDGQPVATITGAEIDDWLRSLPVSPVTRNHYRRLIVLAFNFAMRRGYAIQNPAKETAKAKERGGKIGIFTIPQAARLLEAAPPDVLPYIAIGLFAGLRRAEIERLDWREIDFESGLIEIKAEKSKTAQRRFATLQPNLREWLLAVRKHRGPVTSETFRQSFDQARKAANITRWSDNGLRHSFASYHLAHFKNAAMTALELGHHNSRITFAHYRELVRPTEAARYWSIMPTVTDKVIPLVKATSRSRQ
jgi:integrase